jgi:hypothetical protein
VPGAHLLVAEDSIATARLVNGLLADGPSAQVLGAAGRRRVEQRYSWDAALASLGPLVFGT